MERFAIKIDERVKLSLYNICRLCGIDNRDQVPIVEGPDTTFALDDEPSLCKKIVDCVGIQVKTTDRMPQKICTLCVDKINDFYEYREMCKATNMQTRELLGLPPEIKDEKPKALVSPPQQPFVEIPAENFKRKRKLKSESINYEEIDDDEIDEKPPKKKFPKSSVGAKSKKLLASRRILVKRETVKPLPSRILPTREKAIPISKEKPATLVKEKLLISAAKEKTVKEKLSINKEKNPVVKEKAQIVKEKIGPQLAKGKGQLSKEKLHMKEKLPPQVKDKPLLVKEKAQPVKEKVQIEKEKLKPAKEKMTSMSSKLPILKEKSNKEKTTFKEKLIPLFEEKIESPPSSKLDMELITLKTPNRRERQRELETKKKRKIQTSQPHDKLKTENLYPCIVCPKDFKTQPEYDIHFFRDHTPNTLEHGCSACREAFYDLQEQKDHLAWHRMSSIPFSCFKCDSHFDRLTAYTRHFLASCVPHTEYNIFEDIKCPKCHKTFVTKNLYEWHGCLIKNNSKCPRCNKFFAKRLNLQRHVVECSGKIVEMEPMATEAKSSKSDVFEVEAFTSNDGKKIVKVEPGSILEIEDESHVAVSNSNDDDVHDMEDSVEDDVGFQDDHDDEIEDTTTSKTLTNTNASTEINNTKNLDKDSSDIIPILDDSDSIPIRPIKQERVDRRYDEVICRASTANIPMVQIKHESFNADYIDQVDLNILRNIKPEPVEIAVELNNPKNVPTASIPECPNQSNKVAAIKPTLKLKIKKEHGTLNSSFIDSDLGEGGDSSPNPNRSNDDEPGTTHHRKKRNKHKKKIYKIPKQLALIIKQEKQNRDDRDFLIPEDSDIESRITIPVISEVTSIAESVLETRNEINQMDYYEEEEDTTLSVCVSDHSPEITEDSHLSVELQNDVQVPVIAEVVSLKQKEPCLPLISSVTSLSQSSGIRVKMEFSNFASPRSDPYEPPVIPSDNRIEQDGMITGNYHMEYDGIESTDNHLKHTDREEVAPSTSKDGIESDIEEKPNLEEFNLLSEIASKTIQNSTAVTTIGQICSPPLNNNANTSIQSTETVSNNKLSELSTDITEKRHEIALEENNIIGLYVSKSDKSEKSSENVTINPINQSDKEVIENPKTETEKMVLSVAETSQDIIIHEIIPDTTQTNNNDHIEQVKEKCEINNEISIKPFEEFIKTEINKTKEQETSAYSDDVLKCNPEIDNSIGISIYKENIYKESIDCDVSKSKVISKLDIEQQYKNIDNLKSIVTDTTDSVQIILNNEIKTNVIELLESNILDNNDSANANPDIGNTESQEIINSETTDVTVIHKLNIEHHGNIKNINPVTTNTEESSDNIAHVELKACQSDLVLCNEIPDNDDSKTENSDVIVSIVQEDICNKSNSTVIHKLDIVEYYENIDTVNQVDTNVVGSCSDVGHEEFKESELNLMESNEIPDIDQTIENPYVSVIQEKAKIVESSSTLIPKLVSEEHYKDIENYNSPVTSIAGDFNDMVDNNFIATKQDLVQPNDISDKDELIPDNLNLGEGQQISNNLEDDNSQAQSIIIQEIDQKCQETTFQNQIKLETDFNTQPNVAAELVLSPRTVFVETGKRLLELDDNIEETNHKLQKISENYLEKDVGLGVIQPMQIPVSHTRDEIIQHTHDSSNSNKLVSVVEHDKLSHAMTIDCYCNDDKLGSDADIYPYQTKSNISDVQIDSSNSNNIIYSQTILKVAQDNVDVESKDITDNYQSNEESDNELTEWKTNISKDQTDQANQSRGICETNSNNMGGKNPINISEKFAVTTLESNMDVKVDSPIVIQDESYINMAEVPMDVGVKDDLDHDVIKSRIEYVEEDFNNIPQQSHFSMHNEELSATSEDQYQDENLTDEINETADTFQNENDDNIEKGESNIIFEMKQNPIYDSTVQDGIEYDTPESRMENEEDNFNKIHQLDRSVMRDKELPVVCEDQYQDQNLTGEFIETSDKIQNVNDDNMEKEELSMVYEVKGNLHHNIAVQDDVEHNATESIMQYDEEDNCNKIHQLDRSAMKDKEVPVACEEQYQDENLTGEFIETSDKIQNENDDNMEKELSMVYEVKGNLHHNIAVQDDVEHNATESIMQYDEEDNCNEIHQLDRSAMKDKEVPVACEEQYHDENLTGEFIETSDKIQKENDDNMEKEELSMVYEVKGNLHHNIAVQDDVEHNATESRMQHDEEGDFNKIHKLSHFSMKDEQLSVSSEDELHAENLTEEFNETSDQFQNENDDNMEREVSNILCEVNQNLLYNAAVQDDVEHDVIDTRIQYGIHQLSQIPNKDDNFSIASEDQYHANNLTEENNETSVAFHNEIDINMEKDESSIDYEVNRNLLHGKDLTRHYNINSSEQIDQNIEDSAKRNNDEIVVLTDDESSDDAVPQYQLGGSSNSPCNVSSSESVIDSSNQKKLLNSINMENKGLILPQRVPLQLEENLEEISSNKNEGEFLSSSIKSEEILSNIAEFSIYGEENKSPNGRVMQAFKEVQQYPVLHSDLDEISDKSCGSSTTVMLSEVQLPEDRVLHSELDEISDKSRTSSTTGKLSDAQSPERINTPEITDSTSISMETENVLIITEDSGNPLDDLKKSEAICERDWVSSTADTSTVDMTYQTNQIEESEASSSNIIDSTTENSHNIKIEIKDYFKSSVAILMDTDETSSSSLKVPQTEINTTAEYDCNSDNLVVENEIIQNTIDESAARFRRNDMIATNVETIPENIISSVSTEQITSSQESFDDNLNNTPYLSPNELQNNLTDSIIYNANENEDEIDSDLEKELLEETQDESVK